MYGWKICVAGGGVCVRVCIYLVYVNEITSTEICCYIIVTAWGSKNIPSHCNDHDSDDDDDDKTNVD